MTVGDIFRSANTVSRILDYLWSVRTCRVNVKVRMGRYARCSSDRGHGLEEKNMIALMLSVALSEFFIWGG